jgi:hypothetical protein
MYRTIKAKFAGACRRCGGEIRVGQNIRYGGRGRTYHLKAQCETGGDVTTSEADGPRQPFDELDEAEMMAREYHNPRAVSHYARFASGAEVFVNKSGRCEDAPCCGCCS